MVWAKSWIHFRPTLDLQRWVHIGDAKRMKDAKLIIVSAISESELRHWRPDNFAGLGEIPNLRTICIEAPEVESAKKEHVRDIIGKTGLVRIPDVVFSDHFLIALRIPVVVSVMKLQIAMVECVKPPSGYVGFGLTLLWEVVDSRIRYDAV